MIKIMQFLIIATLLFSLIFPSEQFSCETGAPNLGNPKLHPVGTGSSWSTKSGCQGVPCCVNGMICDQYLGCFEQGSKTPWCHQGKLPESPADIDPHFWVYGPGGKRWTIIYGSEAMLDVSVALLNLDTRLDLWILVHGFGGDWPKEWMFPMKDALIAQGHNVMICRWTKGSAGPDYFQAAANTRVMGAIIARVAKAMMQFNKLNPATTTIVGFSLGAHVAGFAGSHLPGLQKIIGLDPAGPLFDYCGPETRLNKTDANFVMAIHCNGLPLIPNAGCGTMQRIGHIDFFANGGQMQPGCPPISEAGNDILHLNFSQIFGDIACSHLRCPWLFTTSILNANPSSNPGGCKYKGYPCPAPDGYAPTYAWLHGKCFSCNKNLGCPVPGYETTNGTPFKGSFFFGTLASNNTNEEYCGHNFKLALLAGSDISSGGTITVTVKGQQYDTEEIELLHDGILASGFTIGHILHAPWDAEFPTQVVVAYKTSSWHFFHKYFQVASVQVQRDDGKVFKTAIGTTIKSGTSAVMILYPV